MVFVVGVPNFLNRLLSTFTMAPPCSPGFWVLGLFASPSAPESRDSSTPSSSQPWKSQGVHPFWKKKKTQNNLFFRWPHKCIRTSLTCILLSARVAVAQSSSLNLFANRDVELEQRAMLLKRLAFAIFSSEIDQYQKYLPDIQGK